MCRPVTPSVGGGHDQRTHLNATETVPSAQRPESFEFLRKAFRGGLLSWNRICNKEEKLGEKTSLNVWPIVYLQ